MLLRGIFNMPIKTEINEEKLMIHPVVSNKKKQLIFNEAQLLKGLTAKTAHADELRETYDETTNK
jgi:hypothetical protein